MAIYDKEREDRVMIPKWEYRALRDTATRVDVVLAEMEADRYMTIEEVKRILAPHLEKQYTNDLKDVETMDTLADALGYTE